MFLLPPGFFRHAAPGRALRAEKLRGGYIACSTFHTKAREPCMCVAASSSRKAASSGATYVSSTMASSEVFIEGHACVP